MNESRTITPDTRSITADRALNASAIRAEVGFLTPAELAEKYDVPVETVRSAVEAAELCSVTMMFDADDSRATFVPERGGNLDKWLEAQRMSVEEKAYREAAAAEGVDLSGAPSPLMVDDVVEACFLADVLPSEFFAEAERIMGA